MTYRGSIHPAGRTSAPLDTVSPRGVAHRGARRPLNIDQIAELRLGPAYDRPAQFATDAERDEARAQLSRTLAGPDGYELGLMIGGCVNHELHRRHAGHGGNAAEPVAADCHQCNPAGYVPGWLSETTGGN
jgi:hypothetical protein